MEENEGKNMTGEARKGRSSTGLMLLVVLLLLTNAYTLYRLSERSEQVEKQGQELGSLSEEKENVTTMLETMLAQYDTLETENVQIKAEMEAQQEKITDLLDQVKRGKGDIYKLRKEAETLRKIMKGYVATIDSLNQVNLALTAENIGLTQQLGEVSGQKDALESKAQDLEGRIAQGSVLHTTAISAGALFVRNNGKQVETDRARKAEMIKCCFTLGENKVTSAGDKVFFMRIISPDGKVLPAGSGDDRFRFQGVEGEFSAKREVNYQNQPVDVCIFWNASNEMRTGQYIVEIYESEALVSSSTFDLK
ncbi:MAG: hypothetical protein R2810_07095 [Flavobacteriales bacterium]|nr:hypothetical protein [Flavobacteriales bacterium]MCB0784881.1 hypothetical protein [Flavobacteriales bacterium]MCB0810004.1 hypothetical protein [Flavobacteriales bacterium]MCB0816412.1 hypothetical protein [Flavobacteriales bacterium]MCB9181899.1 hypothetical protein [Flavobacteriales bacterium]